MAGRLVDLGLPGSNLPSRLVVDSSIILDWLLTMEEVSPASPPLTAAQQRARTFMERLRLERIAGLVTSTSLAEVLHVVVKTRYRTELPHYRVDLTARFPNVSRHGWEHLVKARSDLMTQIAPGLDRVRRLMTGNRLLVLQPDDLGPIPSGRALDDEFVRAMERYELDSNDAAILVEARRAGVSAIATADADLHRARLDFDVFTWR